MDFGLFQTMPTSSSSPFYFGGPPLPPIESVERLESWAIEVEEGEDGDRFVRGNSFGGGFQTALGRCSPSTSLSLSPALFPRGHIQLHLIPPFFFLSSSLWPLALGRSVEPISASFLN